MTDSATDTLSFLEGVDYDQLWFSKTGTNLTVSVLGGTETVTVSNYFSASNPSPNRGLTMQTQDGHTLTDAGVLQLVSAMATARLQPRLMPSPQPTAHSSGKQSKRNSVSS